MYHNKGKRLIIRSGTTARRRLPVVLLLVCAVVAVTAVAILVDTWREHQTAQDEYLELRTLQHPIPSTPSASVHTAIPVVDTPGILVTESFAVPSRDLSDINSDYIGWLRIDGTAVDYPVVQGRDNEKYMNTTFCGESNASGAIFMDYRCKDGFDAACAILYGHNMRDGSMFASLHRYRQSSYLEEHPKIWVISPEGEVSHYRVFAMRLTDVSDSVFSLYDKDSMDIWEYFSQYSAPKDGKHFLVLSTCTTGGKKDERLLIFSAAEE